MSSQTFLDASLSRLNDLLTRHFDATAADFAASAKSAAAELPEDLAKSLGELAASHDALRAHTEPAPAALADFAFRCGELHSKLEEHRLVQMEVENALVGPDSVATTRLQPAQADRLAGFIAARDRLFRKVADFTLKALLIGLGLLILGLFIGIV